ncbi:MAG: hypothetical protein M1548_08660, partial [Actinobacteria bacterium]|nr:hypothetical protein [Actinomycetota bacterium]
LATVLFSKGGFETDFLAVLRFGPPLFISLPLMLPSLFSGFARPKPGPPHVIHCVLYSMGVAFHTLAVIGLAWVLSAGGTRFLEWQMLVLTTAAALIVAAIWLSLYPARSAGRESYSPKAAEGAHNPHRAPFDFDLS